jgi:hypothetical protein
LLFCSDCPEKKEKKKKMVAPRPGGDFVAPGKKNSAINVDLFLSIFETFYLVRRGTG